MKRTSILLVLPLLFVAITRSPAQDTPPAQDPWVEPKTPGEAQRQLEQQAAMMNVMGLAAVYCDLRGMAEEHKRLRGMMVETGARLDKLSKIIRTSGREVYDDWIREGDRLLFLDKTDVVKGAKPDVIAAVGTFVAKVKPGVTARLVVQRGSDVQEFDIRFGERQPTIFTVINITGLVPGQTVKPPTDGDKTASGAGEAPKPPADARLAPPDDAAQKKSEKEIREVFAEDYAKTGSAARIALAGRLLQQAGETKNDPASRFVLLREAAAAAAEGGDTKTALGAIDELALGYKVDALTMKADALATAEKAARALDDFRGISAAYLDVMAAALRDESFAIAEKMGTSASRVARLGKDIPLLTRAEARLRDIARLKGESEKVQKARDTLKTTPNDPAANLAVGMHHALVRGDWGAAMPHLARGSDGALKDLATRDLAGAKDPVGRASLGDAWWDRAEKDEKDRAAYRRRAVFWYGQALGGLSGLQRTRVEKRLAEAKD